MRARHAPGKGFAPTWKPPLPSAPHHERRPTARRRRYRSRRRRHSSERRSATPTPHPHHPPPPLLKGVPHVAVGASSPTPAAGAMLLRARSEAEGAPPVRLSILGSVQHNFFTNGSGELF